MRREINSGIRRSLYLLLFASIATVSLYAFPLFGRTLAHNFASNAYKTDATASPSPALVELFTSEGCSSCPPADALLAQIQRDQPNAIVLSEHVDYWNSIGWRDPYSSAAATARQQEYSRHFKLNSVYTPQMIIDGTYELIGNDKHAAYVGIERAVATLKLQLSLSNVRVEANHQISFHLNAPPASAAASVYAVVAQNHGSQQVDRGENGGRTLMHVSIARTLKRVDSLVTGATLDTNVILPLPPGQSASDVHLVAFIQQDSGAVVSVASTPVER